MSESMRTRKPSAAGATSLSAATVIAKPGLCFWTVPAPRRFPPLGNMAELYQAGAVDYPPYHLQPDEYGTSSTSTIRAITIISRTHQPVPAYHHHPLKSKLSMSSPQYRGRSGKGMRRL